MSAICLPCVRPEPTLAASPIFVLSARVRLVSGLVSSLAAPPNLVMCLPCLLSTMCPLKPWPCLWTLPPLGLLWGRAVASSGKILSHHFATRHSVYIACPLVSFLHALIFARHIRPSQAHPMLEKRYFGIIFWRVEDYFFEKCSSSHSLTIWKGEII